MSRFCFCNCPAGFSAEPERHAPDCPGRSGAGKARTPVPATLTASQPVESGVDFGIDGRSVRVSQEAYSIFLEREADGREKIAALQQRLTAADVLEAQLSKLSAIGSLIRSQDNRCTDQPMFAVMEKRSLPTLDTHDHDRIDWVETETGDYCLADETKARRLEALHQGYRETPGWERYAMKDIDVFVTACFTEQGCKDFLARDGHNHRSPFIYAFGSYRNGEYQAVREFLKSLPDIAKP